MRGDSLERVTEGLTALLCAPKALLCPGAGRSWAVASTLAPQLRNRDDEEATAMARPADPEAGLKAIVAAPSFDEAEAGLEASAEDQPKPS
jgi:hypothetical protein